jgi:hypothetical protein
MPQPHATQAPARHADYSMRNYGRARACSSPPPLTCWTHMSGTSSTREPVISNGRGGESSRGRRHLLADASARCGRDVVPPGRRMRWAGTAAPKQDA